MSSHRSKADRLVVRIVDHDRYAWRVGGVERQGSVRDLAHDWSRALRPPVWLLLPPAEAPLRRVDIDAREARHAMQSVPYRLEERLLADVDTLQVSIGAVTAGSALIAVIDAARLEALLAPLQEAGVDLRVCTPAQCVLPMNEARVLWTDGATVAWRSQAGEPVRVVDMCASGIAVEALRSANPDGAAIPLLIEDGGTCEPLADHARAAGLMVREEACSLLWLGSRCDATAVVNVLKGRFAPRIPWGRLWGRTRLGWMAIGIAAALHPASTGVEILLLQRADSALRTKIERDYRSVYPQGQLVDAGAQLRARLQELRGAGGVEFAAGFVQFGERLAAVPGLELRALRFDSARAGYELELRVPGHESIEALTRSLAEVGSTLELQSSAVAGQGVQARVLVR